jgi:CelD/BcsL family acetyltransferase involved in cellulose biosynthesis
VAVRCYRAESDCDELGGHLVRVWRRSWHGKLGRQAPPEAAFLREMARLGRLRSYVLMAADAPAATVLGFQHRGTFMDEAPAYDEGWKKHSPGLVLSYLLLKDLFAGDPPRQVDFGFGYNQYKEVLGTRGERRAELWLAVTPKGRAALRAARAGDWLFRAGKAALGRFGVVRRLKLAMKSE